MPNGRRVETQRALFLEPLDLDCGAALPAFTLAYETYGTLDAGAGNAILVCHSMTHDAHAAGPGERAGWWDEAIGAGRTFDTNRFFVVCSNVLGGCGGSTGPASIDPETMRPYALGFPQVTIADMVRAQKRLADRLGIARWRCIAGGCMGGAQALEWMRTYPEAVESALLIGTTARTSAHSLAFYEVLRQAVYRDPLWNRGNYYDRGIPMDGLALSTVLGALFWMSPAAMQERFGRRGAASDTAPPPPRQFERAPEFAVEAFLARLASGLTARFDPNSLLYVSKAMSRFDLGGNLTEALKDVTARTLLLSYDTDWRYPPEQVDELRHALRANGVDVRHEVLRSPYGHGAFLLDVPSWAPMAAELVAASAPGGSEAGGEARLVAPAGLPRGASETGPSARVPAP